MSTWVLTGLLRAIALSVLILGTFSSAVFGGNSSVLIRSPIADTEWCDGMRSKEKNKNSCFQDCNNKCCHVVHGIPVCNPACKLQCDANNTICESLEQVAYDIAREENQKGELLNREQCTFLVTFLLKKWGESEGGEVGEAAAGELGKLASKFVCSLIFP